MKSSRKEYLNPIDFRATLIFAQHERARTNSARNSPFFKHLGAQKLIVLKFLKYHFRPEIDGILQYFSPP